jgi:predicted RNA-binding protein with TRAM domain
LYKDNSEITLTSAVTLSGTGDLVFNFAEETISEGDTETFRIEAKLSATDNGDGITTRIEKDGIVFTAPAGFSMDEDITKTLQK